MIGLQDLIHKLEEGEWSRSIKLGTVLLGLLFLTVFYDLREFRNFSTQEAMDAAQLARNLSEGKGYTTQFLRPFSLHLVQQQRKDRTMALSAHPDIANPPAYPLLLAGWMKVLPFHFEIRAGRSFEVYQPEFLIAIFNQLLFLLVIWMVFRLADRLFDASVAWVSAAVLAGADLFWRFSISGLSTMLLVVIFLCIVWCLISIEPPAQELAIEGEDPATLMPAPAEGPSDRRLAAMAALIGLLAAAGTLTRYSFGWLILPIIFHFLVFFPLRRVTLCLAALLAFSITLAPWLTRNYQLSGALFGAQGYAIVQGTSEFPDNRLERSLSPDLSRIQLEDYFRKFITHSRQIIEDGLPKLGGSWITAFFLVGLMIPFKSPTISRLRIFIVLNLVVLIVVQALGWTHLSADSPVVNSENLLVLVSPLVFIYGSGMFHLLLDQLDLAFPQARRLAIGLFWLVASAPLLFTLLPPRANPVAYPPYFPPRIQESSKWMKESELMMSDVPWAVAWYGRRNCLWLTLDVKHDFYSLNDYQAPVQAIYLTQLTTDAHFVSQVINGEDWAWGRFVMDSLLRTNAPPGFPLKSAPSGFLPEQFFLTDRPRWTLQNE